MPADHAFPGHPPTERSWSMIEVGPGQFEVAGEIDAHSAPMIAERVSHVDGETLVLDLDGVTFIDSSGLRIIVELHQRGLGDAPALVIAHPSRPVVRLFDIAGLSALLPPGNP